MRDVTIPFVPSPLRRAGAAMFVAATIVAAGGSASAQEPKTVEPNEAQVQLYTKAGEAFEAGDYEKAIKLLQSSLDLGEMNITYFNLGRALQKQGDCQGAQAAFKKANTAPRIKDVPHADILARIDALQSELTRTCPGIVVVTCAPTDLKVSVDGGPLQACGALTLDAGEHLIRGLTPKGGKAEKTVFVKPMEQTDISLVVSTSAKGSKAKPRGPRGPWSYILAGTGVGVIAAGGLFDSIVLGSTIDDFENATRTGDSKASSLKSDAESQQSAVIGMYSVGAALLLSGAIVYVLDEGAPADDKQTSSTWSPFLTPTSAGVQGTF